MGGSGGRSYPRAGPGLDDLVMKARSAETERLNTEVNSFLQELLVQFNDRDAELTKKRLDTIASALADVVDVERILLGGSVAKHTAVDGISDVDALVAIDVATAGRISPSELRDRFRDELDATLPSSQVTSVTSGQMAVTVVYTDGMEIQLVPILRSGAQSLIGSPDGSAWRSIKPKAFQEALTSANKRIGGNLVPAIKLMKAINDTLPAQKQLKGYHMEALAIDAAKSLPGPASPRQTLLHVIKHASERVLTPIADLTGQSKTADEYLGSAGSIERRIVSQALGGVRRRLEAASSLHDWKAVFQ